MKTSLTITGVIVLAITIFSAEAHAQKTSADYDRNVNFSNYKTFSFSHADGARNPFVNDMIIAAVERELTARGLTKVDANPDLSISYLAASGFDLHVASVSFGHTVNPVYNGLLHTTTAMWDVTTGTLLIDLSDGKTERTVFRGTAKDTLQRMPSGNAAADAKLVSKQVNKAIAKIFKKYPTSVK